MYKSLDKLDSPNFFLWIDVATQGDVPLRVRQLRGSLERWLAGLDPDDHTIAGKRRDDLPSFIHEDAGWKIDFRAIPRSPEARGRKGARPLGIFGGGGGRVQDDEAIRGALVDKGSAYGSLDAPFVIAVASGSVTLGDYDVLNALYGTAVVEAHILADGTESTAIAEKPDGYWYRGSRWDHRGVSGVLVVKNLHPALVGNQRHTIWEHPKPVHAVDAFPMWRRAVVGADGDMTFVEPERSPADWLGLGNPWPVGEPFPKE
ncbi:hypothetical protein [Phytohabitans aurantiacus]|uniref:Uncharacterized protein n=1 Tax=Phytohabitans aurantiacus TaxID=3016789 RepID=A0ABQ5R8F3_9ACTN|nr:hypothetical protein [Phytohabitans aurantiacus]GLI02940.1 hypothetical protein Pa4123_82180 [Phytohabitans aurantiacus]